VFAGNLRDLVKLNLLFCILALPSLAAFILGFSGILTGFMYILALVTAFPVGGAVVACFFCITKILRDQPGYIWHDFKRKFKENVKQAALPGILCVAFFYSQMFIWGPILFGGASIDAVRMIIGLVVLLIFTMVTPYIFLQIAYIDLKTIQVIKNSLLISLLKLPRSFLGAVTGGLIWIAAVLFWPWSLYAAPLVLLIGFSLSWLMCLMWIWPPVNKQFKITETLGQKL
jgi:uncharacterized membrane protein YesL